MIALIIICVVSFINEANCDQVTPRHGIIQGSSKNSFSCPGNGAIIAIKYYVSNFIHSLAFTCSSPDGIRVFGPYGSEIGTAGNFTCPKGEYISSLYGTSGDFLNSLGARCRKQDKYLKGNGTDFGRMAISTDKRAGSPFDDYVYSDGARIVNVIIWTSVEVESIQLGYAYFPVELCTDNCDDYKEEFSPVHGIEPTKSNVRGTSKLVIFFCPDDGAVIAMKTQLGIATFPIEEEIDYRDGRRWAKRVSADIVSSIQFTCASGHQSPVFGEPFGSDESRIRLVQCLPGMLVGSIHGSTRVGVRVYVKNKGPDRKEYFYDTSSLGIRCVNFGYIGISPKFDAQGGPGVPFDDAGYSNRGWRAMQYNIYYSGKNIYGIRIKYVNVGVSGTGCKVTQIEVIDDVQATFDGVEVLGVATATSCTTGKQLLTLDHSQGVTSGVSITTENGADTNWANDVFVSGSLGGNIGAIGAGYDHNFGGARTWSSSNSTSASTLKTHFAGTEITYDAPGGCLVVGYIRRYKLDVDNVNVRYHYSCESGKKASQLGHVNLQTKSYGKVYFEDYQIQISDERKCTPEVRNCVSAIKADDAQIDSSSLRAEFSKCFKNVTQ